MYSIVDMVHMLMLMQIWFQNRRCKKNRLQKATRSVSQTSSPTQLQSKIYDGPIAQVVDSSERRLLPTRHYLSIEAMIS